MSISSWSICVTLLNQRYLLYARKVFFILLSAQAKKLADMRVRFGLESMLERPEGEVKSSKHRKGDPVMIQVSKLSLSNLLDLFRWSTIFNA